MSNKDPHGSNFGIFAQVRYSRFGIRFRYSVFTVFPDLAKRFPGHIKAYSTETNTKRKILLPNQS